MVLILPKIPIHSISGLWFLDSGKLHIKRLELLLLLWSQVSFSRAPLPSPPHPPHPSGRTPSSGRSELRVGGTFVNILWLGVTLVFQIRASRAESWGVPEVLDACRQQLADLPAYRTAIASAVARAADSLSSATGPPPHQRRLCQLLRSFLFSRSPGAPYPSLSLSQLSAPAIMPLEKLLPGFRVLPLQLSDLEGKCDDDDLTPGPPGGLSSLPLPRCGPWTGQRPSPGPPRPAPPLLHLSQQSPRLWDMLPGVRAPLVESARTRITLATWLPSPPTSRGHITLPWHSLSNQLHSATHAPQRPPLPGPPSTRMSNFSS
jgi:hypothetical protein